MPDGVGNYKALWTRDSYCMVEYAGDLMGPQDIKASINYLLNGQQDDGCIPDRVNAAGEAVYSPGAPGKPMADHALDNGPFMAMLVCSYVNQYNDHEFFIEVEPKLRLGLDHTRLKESGLVYNDPNNPIMYPLSQTSGVVFPYTPSITVNHRARYGVTALTHANYASYFYEGSEVSSISINAEFTVQNIEEGQYLAATIQFFRTMTKMFYGGSRLAGTPPPMVFLDGYGEAYMPHVPCVVTQFTHTMPNDVDYIEVPVGVSLNNVAGQQINANNFASRTRLPTASTLSVVLQPVYSRQNVSDNFTLESYGAGGLIQGSNSPRGGFL